MFSKSIWIILLRCKIRLGFGRKKTGNLFLISCLWLPLMGGGYSVIIPRKQTCSPRLKRSLCKWACRCPTLSFSVDCISHLPRLTGSFRFPGSTRLQRFAPLWIPSPDWWQGSRVRRTLNVWGGMSVPFFNTRRWCNFISNPGKVSTGEWGGCMASSGIISARAAMAFSTAFSSVSLNISMTIFATNLTSC